MIKFYLHKIYNGFVNFEFSFASIEDAKFVEAKFYLFILIFFSALFKLKIIIVKLDVKIP